MTLDQQHWQDRLTVLADKHDVPGATLGILFGGETALAATGVLNLATGVEATTDSLFQIGSQTKVWTGTIIMQLVDEGLLDLDEPIVTYLPEFKVADPDVSRTVTMRHLLTHTSGIDGDHFEDTGRGDDVLERYVASCAVLKQVHPIGEAFSYCNSGFSIMGRVIEVLLGTTWDEAVRVRLLKPLGLEHTVSLPEEALLFRAALGHTGGPDGKQVPVPVWGITRSAGPAGLLSSTPSDVLTFIRMHLDGGLAQDGTRVLSEASVAAMLEPQVEVPDTSGLLGARWGLGWTLHDWDGRLLFGHDGGTIGQSSVLRVLPDRGLAVSLIGNGGNVLALYMDLFQEVFSELADLSLPAGLEVLPDAHVDMSDYLGVYERESFRIEVSERDGTIVGVVTIAGPAAVSHGDERKEGVLELADPEMRVFLTSLLSDAMPPMAMRFFTLPDGSRYIHTGGRTTPKRA